MGFKKAFDEIMETQKGRNEACGLSTKFSYQFDKYKRLLIASEGTDVIKFKPLSTKEDLSRIIKILKDKHFYASKSMDFNDIFDTQIQITNEQITELKRQRFKKDIESEIDKFNNLYRILALSLVDPLQGDSSHMWGLYAKQGKGIAIKYNLNDILQKLYFKDYPIEIPYGFEKNKSNNLYEIFKDDVSFACIQYDKYYNPLERFKKFINGEIAEKYIVEHRLKVRH